MKATSERNAMPGGAEDAPTDAHPTTPNPAVAQPHAAASYAVSVGPGTAAGDAITARNLTRTYGTKNKVFTAVKGINLDVPKGEVFALLGTNGAGKTSTMDMLEGLARPNGGSVRVLGQDPVANRRQLRPHIGTMLQEGGFSRDLTVRETLTMWCGTLSQPRDPVKLLGELNLTDRAEVRVSALSGGERRRLDLACALANASPSVLFLDEPTTGLDPESRATAWELLRAQNANGTTIVLTTHYLEEAEELAARLAIMHQGEIARSGTIEEIVADHPAVITFRTLNRRLPDPLASLAETVGPRTTIETTRLQEHLAVLLRWADAENVTLSGLSAREATLESVFLGIANS